VLDKRWSSVETFLVPHQQNHQFIGRKKLLATLHEKLCEVVQHGDNHRVALHGLGGVGKTQTALAYVYAHRNTYKAIYWMKAANQAELFSSFQDISKRTGCAPDVEPAELAKRVLLWLGRQDNWLVIIDNLDDIKVIDGYLPPTAPDKHTIITTRNTKWKGIPAKELEVGLLNLEEAKELLFVKSEVRVGAREEIKAALIIEELGRLPLAIEQAAAYVKEVSTDFAIFLKEYQQYGRELHNWMPEGIRPYPYSVATTWSVSFNMIKKHNLNAANLIRVLAFLNPDGILIDFLQSGAQALEKNLQQVVLNRTQLAETLLELEKFSLIKWDRQSKTISIHRLVQAVVTDEISDEESKSILNNIIDLFIHAFPKIITNETRSLCRTYQGQIVEPLLRMKTIRISKLALIKNRVGTFLREDGKYDDSEKLLFHSVRIYTSVLGAEHTDTILAMENLASTYEEQGRNADATKIQEDALEKRKRILGEEHPDTLTSMNNLACMYRKQGKWTESAKMQKEMLAKRKMISGEDKPDMLRSMNNLAWMSTQQGKLTEATKMHEEVVEDLNIQAMGSPPVELPLIPVNPAADRVARPSSRSDGRLSLAINLAAPGGIR
jgi:hypothetical protein